MCRPARSRPPHEETGLVAHVFGVEDPDHAQLVAALIPLRDHRSDPEQITSRLRHPLSAYKVPKRLVMYPDEEVPLMSSGKLDLRSPEGPVRDA